MFPNEWEKYQNKTVNAILEELLTEEIAELDRRRGKTGSVAVKNRRTLYTAIYIAVILLCGLMGGWQYVLGLGLMPTALYIIGMSTADSLRMKTLKDMAIVYRQRELAWVVEQDSYVIDEKKPLMARKWISAAVIAVSMGASVLLSATGLPAQIAGWAEEENNTQVSHDEEPYTGPYGSYTWELGEDGYILVDYDTGTQEMVAYIPAEIDGVPVVAIGDRAFENEKELTKITMPDSVTEIGSYAFKGCMSLSVLDLSDSLTAIGGEAFHGCVSLTSFTVPTGVTEIRGNTFQNCSSLRTVTLHDGITAIHAYAFQNCRSLESITLPAGITEIRANTFEYCTSLRSIVIPEGVTRIAAHAFRNCIRLSEVTVPATVTEIGSSAFRDCNALKEIAIPFGCSVNERAFKDSPTEINRY